MSGNAGACVVITVVLGWYVGFVMGKAAEGGGFDWKFLLTGVASALAVYIVAYSQHRRRLRCERDRNSSADPQESGA